ncbi:MAG TPA: DUF1573 domain-containing protein [Patescibacteria group bacterium]|nr:DUF1573 domain-containing protein [Patescibacteria group bacterium]
MRKMTRNFLLVLVSSAGTCIALADAPPTVPAPEAAPKKAETETTQGPKAQFAVPVYDFGRVQAGDLVKYSFVFTNTGDEALEVSHVQPSCGCTTAGDWTRKVEPGQTGTIPVQFNSANFNGQVFKTVSVTSNERKKPVTVLQLKGTVWKPIELVPPYTVINVTPDASQASASIRILNHTEEPLTISPPQINTPTFAVALITNQPGKEYTLALNSATELTTGNIQGKISVKTSSTKTPNLDIPFWVNVQPVITVVPQRLSVPQTPLKAKSPSTITLQNNSTNSLTLSEAAVNVPGVDVQIKELQPGKLFNAIVTFPEGFEAPAGKPMEVTIKSSQPRMPEIKVPIVAVPQPMLTHPVLPQPQKPTASAAAPAPVPPAIR